MLGIKCHKIYCRNEFDSTVSRNGISIGRQSDFELYLHLQRVRTCVRGIACDLLLLFYSKIFWWNRVFLQTESNSLRTLETWQVSLTYYAVKFLFLFIFILKKISSFNTKYEAQTRPDVINRLNMTTIVKPFKELSTLHGAAFSETVSSWYSGLAIIKERRPESQKKELPIT